MNLQISLAIRLDSVLVYIILVGIFVFNIALRLLLSADPFFVRQQIISLRDEGWLRFGSNGWYWDIDTIEEIYDTSDNVVVMLSGTMKR